MKKYKFKIDGVAYEVELESIQEGKAKVRVNGMDYDVEIPEQSAKTSSPVVRPKKVEQPRATASSPQGAAPRPKAPAGAGSICSPLPGVVQSLRVREGDTVKVGDNLLVIEAMKMENIIEADRDGVVQSIAVREGDSIMEGDVLLTIGE